MTERRRPPRRGRSARPKKGDPALEGHIEADPYLDASEPREAPVAEAPPPAPAYDPPPVNDAPGASHESGDSAAPAAGMPDTSGNGAPQQQNGQRPWQDRGDRPDRGDGNDRGGRGRRGRRQRGRRRGGERDGNAPPQQQHQRGPRPDRGDRGNRVERDDNFDRDTGGAPQILVIDGETQGWFDPARDAGFIRRAEFSYLNEPGDTWVSPHVVKQYGLRRGDAIHARTGRDHRGRVSVAEIITLNGSEPVEGARRPDFGTLTASYPERRLTLETGRSAKGGPELTRRAIDLIAPIGFGQRALIVAPARAGKTMLMQAITEGIAINHPEATLLILLVDERPEEVSEAISWGVGEVVASSFDQPAKRHVEVVEMVIERSRRLVEQGKDVIIVLDSLTRMARAFNTAERGTGRTLSGGLDTSAMAKPKAFFGSARNILPQHGGGSLTIIATALVETGSRMDDVIFEEFKGTGNCEIKLDRSLAEKRIFPAFDIATSGTRREEKLYKAEQIDAIYTLRRGLQQMPPQAGMEWLIKRIASTTSNDALLAGL
jgi:transcription termination factor Rho